MEPKVIGSCFFCDKPVLGKGAWTSKEAAMQMLEQLGEMPKTLEGTIGNKKVCRECGSDLWALVQRD